MSHAEGRVVLEGGQPIYEYFVKDHLGNVRQVLRAPETASFMATMETDVAIEEEEHFHQLEESRQADFRHNVTVGGDKVAWLNADRGRVLGPNTSKEIFEGEHVTLAVYGKYADIRNKKANKSSLLPGGALERVINDAGEMARGGNANAATVLQLLDLIAKDLQKRKTPEAYLFYALYDSDSVLYETGKQVLSKKAANQHEKLEETLYIFNGRVTLKLSSPTRRERMCGLTTLCCLPSHLLWCRKHTMIPGVLNSKAWDTSMGV